MLSDYGAFRDLQRHRLLSIDWQALGPTHGYTTPAAIDDVGAASDWHAVLEQSAALHAELARDHSPLVAQYAVSMAYRIRFYMHMNAREAMHVIELRTAPQGHPAYRRVCQAMHRLICGEGRSSGHRRGDDVRGSLRGGAGAAGCGASHRATSTGRRRRRVGLTRTDCSASMRLR